MSISTLPTPPSRSQPSDFSVRCDAFLGALPTFATEANALAVEVNNNKVAAAASETAAAQSVVDAAGQVDLATVQANLATNQAAVAAAANNAPAWVSGTTYTLGQCVYSPLNNLIYRRIVAGAGTTDPSLDGTNWYCITLVAPPAAAIYQYQQLGGL